MLNAFKINGFYASITRRGLGLENITNFHKKQRALHHFRVSHSKNPLVRGTYINAVAKDKPWAAKYSWHVFDFDKEKEKAKNKYIQAWCQKFLPLPNKFE